MQVDDEIEAVLVAPVKDLVEVLKAVADRIALSGLEDVVVNGHADVVEPPGCDGLDVVLLDEAVKMLPVICTLGEPASEIDASHKAFELFHAIPP